MVLNPVSGNEQEAPRKDGCEERVEFGVVEGELTGDDDKLTVINDIKKARRSEAQSGGKHAIVGCKEEEIVVGIGDRGKAADQ